MKKSVLLVLVAMLAVVAGTQYVMQLAPDAVITIEAIPPVKISHDGWDTQPSTGMDVVGVESLVYLSGAEAAGEEVSMYEWTLTGPDGSTAMTEAFDPVGDGMYPNWQVFRPDMEGSYEVGLTVTTASGTATTAVTITAAMYVGAGGFVDGTVDFMAGQCAGCHSDVYSDWIETDHSFFFELAIDGTMSSHYGEGCIDCHTAGFDTSAMNGGFDDLAEEHGWTFPDTLQAGNWADMVANYPEVAGMANIQCENCHGPGSLHKGDVTKIDVSVMTGMCAQCHNDGHYHRRPAMWEASGHGSGTSFSRGTREGCATCHSTWGFIATVDPTSDHDQKVGTGLDKVECVACHDPHVGNSDEHPYQLRSVEDVTLVDGTVVTWGGYGKACMTCHQARRTGATQLASGSSRQDPHHSNQTDMLAGNNIAHTFGRYIPSSTHRDALEDACVDCHMAATPGGGEPGADIIGDHSFAMTAELEDGTLVENTAACVDCHGAFDSFKDFPAREDYDGDGVVEGAQDELHGLMDELGMLIPPLGDPEIGRVEDDWTKLQVMGTFNSNFVHDDASNGMHNFQYAINLMKVTINALNYGELAEGSIVEVTDIPNDQGKQVNVVWTRFGGDGTSDDPVTMYYVWRKGMTTDVAGKDVTVYNDVTEVPPVEFNGAPIALKMADDYWTAVGSQPAAEMEFYGAVVPTLYDATATDTTMTEFMVSAHTVANNNVASESMMGYSVDNLVPMAPMGVAAAVTWADVTLTWDDAIDEDFNYFAIYRGDVSGFDPTGMEAMGSAADAYFVDTDVEVNTYYYYRIAAVDFAGNVGEFSDEVVAAVSVGVEGETPIDYALHQNYPNPFNPTTTLAFDVAATSFVQVAVYDLLGRQVQVLVNETRDAGRHSVQLHAGDLTSGLYIVRMEASGRVFERAITLIK